MLVILPVCPSRRASKAGKLRHRCCASGTLMR
jgi:hypothetical protein